MIEDLVSNLTYHFCMTIFFFGWPVAGAVATLLWGRSRDSARCSLGEALYYSVATYFRVGDEESNLTRFKWAKLIHRLVGIIAWAYITAVFIITIT